ncbi:aminoacyl-tRNA deacylase [Streptomyces canarius]
MSQPAEPTSVLSPEEVLRRSGVPFTVLDHVPIVGQEDAETKLGLTTEQLLKTMVFRTADGGFVLAALPVTGRVNYGRLARAAGVSRAKLRQAEPGELSLLGMEPGGASPVCDLPDVVIVFDGGDPDGHRVLRQRSRRPDRTDRGRATDRAGRAEDRGTVPVTRQAPSRSGPASAGRPTG